MKYCGKCGKQIQDSNKFCPYCGHPVQIKEDFEKRIEKAPVSKKTAKKFLIPLKVKKAGISVLAVALCCGGVFAYQRYFKKAEIDILKNVKLKYDGLSGYAHVTVASNKIAYHGDNQKVKSFLNEEIAYIFDQPDHVANGDTITLKAEYSVRKAKALKLNLKDTQKKIKVSGVTHTFHKGSEISSQYLKKLRKDAYEKMQHDFQSSEFGRYKMQYINSWLIDKKDDYYNQDHYVACYKVIQIDIGDSGPITTTNYFAYAYINDFTSKYYYPQAAWYTAKITDRKIMSSKQLRGALSKNFKVKKKQVKRID